MMEADIIKELWDLAHENAKHIAVLNNEMSMIIWLLKLLMGVVIISAISALIGAWVTIKHYLKYKNNK